MDTFDASMDQDLGLPRALAEVHKSAKSGGDPEAVRDMMNLLGFNMPAPTRTKDTAALSSLAESLIVKRDQARAEKNWSEADAIRDMLVSSGIKIEDSPTGTKWSIK